MWTSSVTKKCKKSMKIDKLANIDREIIHNI